jgi:hypothetical protein
MILPDFTPAADIFVAQLAAIHIRMVAGFANVVEEKSFWLRRPDLNQRTWGEPRSLGRGLPSSIRKDDDEK